MVSANLTLSPSQMIAFLSKTIPANLPVLMTSPPGCGKTDVGHQAAHAVGYNRVIVSHPVLSDPTDGKGMPALDHERRRAEWFPFGEVADILASQENTLWFIDDIGQAPPAVQASYMRPLLHREVNGQRIPDCVSIIGATNRRTDKAGVSGVLEPVKGRFAAIVEMKPSLDDWIVWAERNNVDPEDRAFLRFRPDLLCAFVPTADLTNSPTPRGWSFAAKHAKLGFSEDLLMVAWAGAVGAGAATERMAFRRMYSQLPNIDKIMDDPDKGVIPTEPATLYAVVTALGHRTTVKNFPRIARYAERLTKAQHGEFAALLVRDSARREPAVLQTPEFVRMASSEFGHLISGGGR